MYSKMYVLVAMSVFFFGNLVVTNHAEEVRSFQVIHPTGNIYVGDQVQLQCVISGFVDSTDAVLIFIRDDNSYIRTLATEDGTYKKAPQNVQSSGIQQNSILTVTINDIDETFGGSYTCYTARTTGIVLDQEHLTLDVLLPPPICSTVPTNDDLIFNNMDEIRFTCISEIGNPQSMLFWNLISETDIALPPADTTSSSNAVTSTIYLILTTNYHGTIFTCMRESDLETCTIGPLQLRSLLPTTDTLLVTFTESSKHTANSTMSTGLQSGVIVAIVSSVIVIIAIVSVAIIVGIRSRHVCVKSKSNTALADNSHDNPHMSIDNHDGHSPAEGENYTSLQKNTLEDKSDKLYQDLLPVPRSSSNTDGDQCTNVGMVSLKAEEPDYVVKSVSHKTMNASKHDSGDYEDIKELPGETYEEIPDKCYEEIPESRAGISPIPAAQEPKSVVQHVYLDFTSETDANTDAPEAAASMLINQHDQSSPVHVNSSNEILYANQTRVEDFK